MVEPALFGIVAIGRNEGDRLVLALRSIPPGVPVVYVDSDSTDGSVAFARSAGAEVVELDLSIPFTAARGRNAGAAALLDSHPDITFIQFIDGDCEVEKGWLDAAAQFLAGHPGVAAVCGRRRERYPERSFYNRMCDIEWNTPVGEAGACGGDAMFRVTALRQAQFYDAAIIAGEEPELCGRLRSLGWKIWRIDAPMTIHDADMHHWRQWWMRTVRSGFGYAQVWWKTRRGAGDPLYGRELFSAIFWTLGILGVAVALTLLIGPPGLLAAPAIWFAQFARLSRREGAGKAALLLGGKLAELIGAARFLIARMLHRRQGAIFYK